MYVMRRRRRWRPWSRASEALDRAQPGGLLAAAWLIMETVVHRVKEVRKFLGERAQPASHISDERKRHRWRRGIGQRPAQVREAETVRLFVALPNLLLRQGEVEAS